MAETADPKSCTLFHSPQVKPKLGRMILWPSVKDADSLLQDERTHHEACNVIKGHKKAANLWVHLYDWNTPVALGWDTG